MSHQRRTPKELRRLSDTELICLARRHREAFGELYRRYRARVEAFVLRLTNGDKELARDITQETFLRAFRVFHRYRPKTDFLYWLFAIARNLAVSRFRRVRRTVPLEEALAHTHALHTAAPPTLEVERAWFLQRLAAAIRLLRPRERAVVREHYLYGKPLARIAQEWGVSENAVKLLLSRTRRKVRHLLNL